MGCFRSGIERQWSVSSRAIQLGKAWIVYRWWFQRQCRQVKIESDRTFSNPS
ncbi:hypothetical protein [Arthrospira platensis]|uniref:hypothetical protein n=1 Tax=Limnospira platensis TaxID=118562 RepID=UPI0012FFB5C0|nr:hypothetical protein [Arthrospira platensis]MBD2670884.1 hypothetical protein [Arthrospira platensis FACHB-439]MBD2712907.1 hypothetical protein [Arthrospira platensis FACHB-835]MDF2211944.1 hypothetical protein [Arthrospira platensis NCB002]QQW27955.1 hypothetical protein AP9108_22895 [Arthrospira sp. PCC 9108]MBD2574353.1 hypothetical protein [Arthrospira platensis FACHB-971]